MKRIRLKHCVLWISLIGNVFLLAIIIFIGCVKTNYISSKLEILGIMTADETKRGDYYCIEGWTNTIEKLHLNVDVVFFGNSIICGSSFDKYFPNAKICNLGYGGDTTVGMLLRVNQIKAVHPQKVFMMAGINGLHIQSEDVFEEKYSTLVDSIKKAVPYAKIYIQSILPVNPNLESGKTFDGKLDKIKKCNDIIRRIAEERECTYVDLYKLYAQNDMMPEKFTKDGVHLYPEAYDRWAEEIKKYIEEAY